MKIPRVSDIVGIINKIAPFTLAEEWDNVGLQSGNPASTVNKIMVALDPSIGAVESAVAANCQLLLTHHPLLFKPLKKIALNEPTGYLISLSLKNDLSIVSLHTNYDLADAGLNDVLAERLDLDQWGPLKVSGADELVKLAVFVPKGYESGVLESLLRFGVTLGNYRDCSFQASGLGTFTPLDGAQPFLGSIGARESVDETRLEVLIVKDQISAAVSAMKAAHPYEEPAYDLYPLLNKGKCWGLGRIGDLSEAVPLVKFAGLVKERLSAVGTRFVGEPGKQIRKVALCGGSGASLIKAAARMGADVLVTGDIKYHDAREAEALGIALIDAGHFATEVIMVGNVAGRLAGVLREKGYAAEMVAYEGERDPFKYT